MQSPLKALGRSALEILRTRAELVAVEFAQERQRLARIALQAALAIAVTGLGLQLAAALALISFWDTPYRMHAAVGITALFLASGAACAFAVILKWNSRPPTFGTSVQALQADIEALKRMA
jgi:uncharacterized membrane protein YqjE